MRRSSWAWVALLLGLSGCLAVSPRFSQDVTTSFARDEMRHLETPELELYYPAQAHAEALRIAARLSHCLRELRKLPHSGTPRDKLLLYLTSANFNNAYVQPMIAGSPQQMVVPLHETSELFNLFIDPGGEVADISCHEAVHYVQLQEVNGLWRAINFIAGNTLSPNIFTESWFLEGLAVHYEGRLGKDVGRPWNPLWHGVYDSGIAANHGKLNAGYLQPGHRDASPFGGSYLIGEHFVSYLADRYGEDKLWELVEKQASSWLPPILLSFRFQQVYGKTLGTLFDEYSEHLQREAKAHPRPPEQRTLAGDQGSFTRIAAARDGSLAVISTPRDEPPTLAIYEPDDRLHFKVPLLPILPERPFVSGSAYTMSGITFSRDGKSLFFVVDDVSSLGDDDNRLVQVDAQTGEIRRTWAGLEGMGGDLSADGTRYIYTHLDRDTANLYALRLDNGTREPVTHYGGRQSLGTAAVSPDGKRIVFPKWQGLGFDLFILEDGQERALTHDQRFNQSPRWVDDGHVVVVRDEGGHAQAFVIDIETGAMRRATDAPFVAFDPAPRPGGRLAFVNREAWSWTVDQVPLDTSYPSAVVEPPSAAPENAEEDVVVEKDEAYSPIDHLLLPTLHAPYAYGETTSDNRTIVHTELDLAGSDRLGLHNYGVGVQLRIPGGFEAVFGEYLNYQLAPWLVGVGAGYSQSESGRRDTTGAFSIGRTFWTVPLSFGTSFIHREEGGFASTVVGPAVGASYSAIDGSSYGGAQRGFALGASTAVYPASIGNDLEFADLRGTVSVYLPQPVRRGSLRLSGLGRALPGAPKGMLSVGGVHPLGFIGQSRKDGSDGRPDLELFTGLSFGEGLRGYEDFTLHCNNVEVAGLDYHYPIIIDHGWASFLYIFPSFMVSQVDINAFARLARTEGFGVSTHRVVGGSIALRTSITNSVAPSLFYQFAQRFDDGLGPLHLFGLSF